METIFSSRRNAIRRSTMTTSGSVYQATPFGTPPLARQSGTLDPLRGYVTGLSSQHSSTCSGSSSWVLWRDEPSLYRDPRARRGRLCSALLAIAVFLVVLTVLSIAGLAVYMGALRIDTNKPELVFDGSVKITLGDEFVPALNNNNSAAFKEMAFKYQNMIDKVYQRSQLGPAYKKCVVEKFENGSLVVFFRLYLDRRKIPRSFQNVEETARDILVNELISPRTAAFKNVEIDATSIFIKRFIDDIENNTKKKQPSGNKTIEIRNGVLRKPGIKSSSESSSTPEFVALNTDHTSTEPEMKVKQTVGEAVPVIEGSVVVTRIKNGSSSNPLFEKSNVAKIKNNTVSLIKEFKNELKVPQNISVMNNENVSNYAVNVTSDISLSEPSIVQAINSTAEKIQNKKLYDVENEKENRTTNKYVDEKYSVVDEILVTSDVIKDISGTNEENGVIDQETPNEMLKDNKSKSQNQTLTKKAGEKDTLLIGSDQTSNPLDFKTNSYNERYQSQWSTRIIPTLSYNLNPSHLQTEEPWRPILPYYTKHSPKPVRTYEHDDDVGTGVAEVMAVPPSAMENSATDQRDNVFSSKLGQPASEGIGNKQPQFSSSYGSFSISDESISAHHNDTVSRVSLHVVGTGVVSNEETSLLHTTSGGGIIVRKQTVSPPHTIPLSYTTSQSPFTRSSIDNPFTVPELPILHQFHDVDAILKPPTSSGSKYHSGESFHGDFNSTNQTSVETKPREPVISAVDHSSESVRSDFKENNDTSDKIKGTPILVSHNSGTGFFTTVDEQQIQNLWRRNSTNNIAFRETSVTFQPRYPISTSSENYQNSWTDVRKRNETKNNPVKIHSINPNLGVGSVSPVEESQWIELVNVTTAVGKPQRVKSETSSLHQDTPHRYQHRPLWGDLEYRNRPNYKIQDFSSAESSSSTKTHVNKTTRIELTTSRSSYNSTSIPLVTLIPVRSNSGIGRPLRPRPRIPPRRNQTDMSINLNTGTQYIPRNETRTTGYEDHHVIETVNVLYKSEISQLNQSIPKRSHTTNSPILNVTHTGTNSSVKPHVTLSSSNIPTLTNTYKFTITSLPHINATLSSERENTEEYKTTASFENNRSQYYTNLSQNSIKNSTPLTTGIMVKLKSSDEILKSTPISVTTEPTVIAAINRTTLSQNLTLSEKTTMPSIKFTTETLEATMFTPSVIVTTPTKSTLPTTEKKVSPPSRKTTELSELMTMKATSIATSSQRATPSSVTSELKMKTTTLPFIKVTSEISPTTQSKIIEIFTKPVSPLSPSSLQILSSAPTEAPTLLARESPTESNQLLTTNALAFFPKIVVTSINKTVSTSMKRNSSSVEIIPSLTSNSQQEKNISNTATNHTRNITKVVGNKDHQLSNETITNIPLQVNSSIKSDHSKLQQQFTASPSQLTSTREPTQPPKSVIKQETTTVNTRLLTTQTTPLYLTSQSLSSLSLLLPTEETTKSPKSTISHDTTTVVSSLMTTQSTPLSLISQNLSSPKPELMSIGEQTKLSKSTVSHLATIPTRMTPNIPHSSPVPSVTPPILSKTPVMVFNEYIPVIIIQNKPQKNQSESNSSKNSTESIGKGSTSSYSYTTNIPLKVFTLAEEIKNRTKEIPRNQTHQNKIIASTSISYITNKNENSSKINEKLISTENKSNSKMAQNKTELANSDIESTTSQVIVLNTDVVTTTSIEISFGENETTTIPPPKKINETITLPAENFSKPVTVPTLFSSTHKIKEIRRQPKMRDISLSDSSMIEGQLLLHQRENDDYSDNIRHPFVPYFNTTTVSTTDVFTEESNQTQHVVVTMSKYDPNNFNYSITFDIPSTLLFKFNGSLNSTTESTFITNDNSLEELLTKDEKTTASQTGIMLVDEEMPSKKADNILTTQSYQEVPDVTLSGNTDSADEIYSTNNLSTFADQDFSITDDTTDKINIIGEIVGTYTNFTVTKTSDPTNTERAELSDDELLCLLHLGNKTNNNKNNNVMSQDAVDALSKFANIHTNEPKTSEDDITTEKTFEQNITKSVLGEDEKLSTKAISSSSSNNHAGIPILTKIYNKAPEQFDDRVPSLKSSPDIDYIDLTNETDCSGNTSLKCGDGECISVLSRCNQLVDCSDGTDERDCTCADYLKAQFLTRKLCDGIVDCWDFSDENNCEWCTPGQFVCPNSQVCVDKHRLCDGSRDCPYGDDEKQCVTVAQNEAQAGDFQYSSEGYLMVRKQGRWGKLCLQNFDKVVERSQSPWEVSDLGRAVCKAMTYSDFDRVNRTVDVPGSSRSDDSHYYELAYSSDVNGNTSQPRSSLSFQETQCNRKEVVHVSCRDLECGVRPQAINQWARIVGGGNAAPGAWPWQAALYKEGEFQCGATLIADRWLVSAGHCFYHALDDYWVARLGALRRGSSFPSPYEQLRPVSHIILHPGYVDTGFLNDISLLRLREPVQFSDFVRPVCLPPPPPAAAIKDGRLCTVVGWGQLFEFGRIFPDTLQEVQLPIISTAECRKRTLFLPLYRVTDNMFCAGFDRGGRDACLGDSGGPLMCQEKDGRWSLYGVTSNGYGCARANRPGVYTKVANYVPWLQAAMIQQVSTLRDSKTQCKGHRCPLGECLPSTRICNGFMECSDGSDEKDCW